MWVSPHGNNQVIEVPCGKCMACLSNKRTDWSFRLEQELKRSSSAAFITLTYHSKYVPDSGVNKKHFQLFMKRLRKKSGDRLRYYAVGEYGTKNNRPHYHAIIFNFQGNERFLSSIWPFGIVHIGKVTQASIMYTTKYVIQASSHKEESLNKPFALMSRRFGLGLWYLTDAMAKWHRENAANYTMIYGKKGRLARYYKEKLWPNSKWNPMYQFERERISKLAKQEAEAAHNENLAFLKKRGYLNPEIILTEMRNAVISRVKQKVAFTQKF